MKPTTTLLAAWLTATLLAAPAPSLANDPYPSRPIKVIVPFPAGGGGDILARLTLGRASKELGQSMVFENVPGAGGNIGSQTAAKAPNDGYTLLYGTNGTFGINHTLYKKPGFDPLRDFVPVGQLSRIAAMLVVRANLPAQNMPELMALVKASPGKFTFASAGNGTTSHLAGEILSASAGLSMLHVPYKGGAAAMTDLIGGQVDLMIDVMPNTVSHVRGGKVRGLAVSTVTRVPQVPDMPTIAESGVAGFDVSAWDALFAPAGTPPAVVEKLNAALQKALADPELRTALNERGAEATPGNPQALARLVQGAIDSWGKAVRSSGATVD